MFDLYDAAVSKRSSKRQHPILKLKHSVLSVLVYLLIHTIATSGAADSQPNQKSRAMATNIDITKSVNGFAGNLLDHIQRNEPPTKNIIVSPLSVQTALGLALVGATGETYKQLLDGLKLSSTVGSEVQRSDIADAFHQLLAPLETNPMLKIANKIYVQQHYHIKAAFDQLAKEKFASETQTLDFANAGPSAAAINEWVESKTNNRIKDLISSDSLSADTRMVLVNAIYFKGSWQHQFPPSMTVKAPFYTSETESTDVDTMHVTQHFRYGEWADMDATALELRYKDSQMAMLIVLPNKKDGLPALLGKLNSADVGALAANMFQTEVVVSLPKFKIEYEVSLQDVLQKMGMDNMFSDSATFNDLLEEQEPLKVSDVVHKAFIEVNEEGAEAAAATGLQIMTRSMPMPSNQQFFVADHPFSYSIIHVVNRTPLFSGVLNNIPKNQ